LRYCGIAVLRYCGIAVLRYCGIAVLRYGEICLKMVVFWLISIIIPSSGESYKLFLLYGILQAFADDRSRENGDNSTAGNMMASLWASFGVSRQAIAI